MFTGIIAARGSVRAVQKAEHPEGLMRLSIDAGELATDMPHGGSLAVDGVCLTVVHAAKTVLDAEVMGETLHRTTLGSLDVGDRVNLERCTPLGGRLDGHIVQGHVDAVGQIEKIRDESHWRRVRISIPENCAALCAEKGSVTVDGVSLTITAVSAAATEKPRFEVALIPETLAATGLGEKAVGARLNIEVDVIARYTARLLSFRDDAGRSALVDDNLGTNKSAEGH